MIARVVHVRDEPFDVYIGRPRPGFVDAGWGNPYRIGVDGDRVVVLAQYAEWLADQPKLRERARIELRGKVLGCWCAPKPCHGDFLAAIANGANDA